jgi:hypothetical protein
LSEFQSLLRSPAWVRLVELASEQVALRQSMVMAMEEKGLEDMLESIRLKAESRAIKLFVSLPENIIEQMKEDLGYVEDEVETAG